MSAERESLARIARRVTLGIPPTSHVEGSRRGQIRSTRVWVAKYVSAYRWFGRPWLHMRANPFLKVRELQLVRTTPPR